MHLSGKSVSSNIFCFDTKYDIEISNIVNRICKVCTVFVSEYFLKTNI